MSLRLLGLTAAITLSAACRESGTLAGGGDALAEVLTFEEKVDAVLRGDPAFAALDFTDDCDDLAQVLRRMAGAVEACDEDDHRDRGDDEDRGDREDDRGDRGDDRGDREDDRHDACADRCDRVADDVFADCAARGGTPERCDHASDVAFRTCMDRCLDAGEPDTRRLTDRRGDDDRDDDRGDRDDDHVDGDCVDLGQRFRRLMAVYTDQCAPEGERGDGREEGDRDGRR